MTIAGIELLRRVRKGQFNLGRLRFGIDVRLLVWEAVLAAQ